MLQATEGGEKAWRRPVGHTDGSVVIRRDEVADVPEALRDAIKEAPDHDLALYMLAAVLALRNETGEAVPHLLRAIELNPENRAMARHDTDLESLRENEQVREALEAVPPSKTERRRSPRV